MASSMEKGTAGVGSIPLPVMDSIPLPDGSPKTKPQTKSRKLIKLVRYDVSKNESQIPLPVTKKDPPKPVKELIAEKLKQSDPSNMAKDAESKCSSGDSNPVSTNHNLYKLKRSLMQKERNVEGPLEQSIVDEMFKDFLATKMQQIESEYQGKADDAVSKNGKFGEVVSSVEEMNRLLDDELTAISQNTSQKGVCVQVECSQTQSIINRKQKSVGAKLETKGKRSKWDMTEKLEKDFNTDRSVSKPQVKAENVCGKSSIVSTDVNSKPSSDQQSRINIESPGGPINMESTKSSFALSSSITNRDQEILMIDGTISPLPPLPGTKTEEEVRKVNTNINIALAAQFGKKTQTKKQISLKISQLSAEIISSGELTGKESERQKALEDGEVLSSNDDSEKHDSNDEDSDEDEGNNAVSETGSLSDSEKETKSSKSKKKKKKKNKKHKKKKKHKSSKDQEKDDTKRDESKRKHRSRSRSKSPKKHKSSHSPGRRSRKSKSRSPNRWEDRGFDAYAYRETGRNRSRDKDRGRGRSRERSPERSRGRSRERSPERLRDRSKDRTRNRSRDRGRERGRPDRRSRSRSLDKSLDLRVKIDKAKLREIAIKNVLAMAKSGHGPSVDITTIKAGGTSVDELTDFCKRISSKEKNRGTEPFLSSSSEESEVDEKDEEESFIHHPFKVRDPSASIVMNIRNAKPLPVLTPQEKITEQSKLRMQFPVSSGSVHRLKEPEWVPVQKTTTNAVTLLTNTPTTASLSASTSAAMAISNQTSPVANDTIQFKPPLPPSDPPPPPPPEERVFPETSNVPMDIGSIISERLLAVRKLQENPKDISALSNIADAQKKASMWATSKQLPGQFIGSTGAQILTPDELMGPDKRHQAWAKKLP
ncbi:protein Son-like isoform X2 [Ylistrum balloti]|uniref:protein Son-like isoform X2 n=1 Tax=Ylistrum balloti TaxID=509963 RepID=UPI002905A4D4|nr:protein Son-like isoform X2 [Ylistrum balloti]